MWRTGTSDVESRAHLQARLTTLFELLFWCFVALMAFLFVAYERYPSAAPRHQDLVYATFAVGITIQAAVWRVVLVRRKLTLAHLRWLDTAFAIGANSVIALCAIIAFDRRQSAYTCLIYTCWTVLTRALVIPSTGRRTAIVTTLAMMPMGAAVCVLMSIKGWTGTKDVPTPAMVVGYVQIAAVAVLLSAQGSRIIYGLQQKVSAAQQLGQYTLGRLLGQGGNGMVYLAHHALLRRPTAVKLMPSTKVGAGDAERFEREVQFMSQLTHPNTVAVYDYGHSARGFYYAMEYLGGGIDLSRLVEQHGKQPAERVRQILLQVCSALEEAHARDLIHRDIKPANIILCERGGIADFVKVVDFGLVKELTANTGLSTQVVLGTPSYIAPEAMTDPDSISFGVDIYAIGAVGFFLLTGERPFTGATDLDVCMQHVSKPAPRPSERGASISGELDDLIVRCLAKTPAERPASVAVLAESLRGLGTLDDWNDESAAAWWAAHRPSTTEVDATGESTSTLSIDIHDREAA